MEKTIARWSYWLGITSVIVATAWKGGNAFGLWRALPPTPADISYWSFYNASLMFFATSIASACRVWLKSVSKDVGAKRRPTRESVDGAEPEAPSYCCGLTTSNFSERAGTHRSRHCDHTHSAGPGRVLSVIAILQRLMSWLIPVNVAIKLSPARTESRAV